MTRSLVLLSGGMDSAVLLSQAVHAGDEVLALSFDYGQRHGHRELAAADEIAARLNVRHWIIDLSATARLMPGSALTDPQVDVPDGHYAEESMRITIVPNRNLAMLAIAGGVADTHGAGRVLSGVHAGDHFVYPDCRPEFIAAADRAFSLSLEGRVRAEAPFLYMSKADIAELGANLGAPLELSWSCYRGGDHHCGRCGTCTERAEAFSAAGVLDPTIYEDAPLSRRTPTVGHQPRV